MRLASTMIFGLLIGSVAQAADPQVCEVVTDLTNAVASERRLTKEAQRKCVAGDTLYIRQLPTMQELVFLCDVDKPVIIEGGRVACRYPGVMIERK